MQKRKKIILITIDCLRYDHLHYLGFSEYFGDYLSFENCYTAGEPTYLSFPSLFQSIYPSKSMKSLTVREDIMPFIEILGKNNYSTAAFVDSNPFCSSILGHNKGFEFFEDNLYSPKKPIKIKNYIPKIFKKIGRKIISNTITPNLKKNKGVIKITNLSLEYLRNNKEKNIFLWMHFMDAHFPYWSPSLKLYSHFMNVLLENKCHKIITKKKDDWQNIVGCFREAEIKKLKRSYKEEIIKLGKILKSFFESIPGGIEEYNLFITSDHGEEFFEHGGFLHRSNIHEEVTHVPLVIKIPEKDKSIDAAKLISLVDIPTTILDIVRLKKPKEFEGINIFKDSRDYVISETASKPAEHFSYNIFQLKNLSLESMDLVYSIRNKHYSIIGGSEKLRVYDRINDPHELKGIDIENEEIKNLKKALLDHKKSFGSMVK